MADIKKLTENLEKNGFVVSYYETAAEAAAALADKIQGKTVGFGGSMTLKDMGLYEKLGENNRVYWHWKCSDPEVLTKALNAQVYVTSLNGVAETGELINIDGNGNRLASAMYAKEKVYFVIGVNKIAPDLDSAMNRARNIAAPLNAKRLNKQTPCALSKEMKCYDCSSPDRICNGVSLFYRKMGGVKEMEVVIINEELGY